jgi:hypothetical protein
VASSMPAKAGDSTRCCQSRSEGAYAGAPDGPP